MIFLEDGGVRGDVARVLAYIAQLYQDLRVENIDVNADQIFGLVRAMHTDFPYPGGEDGASPFKKVAHFVCHFVHGRPVRTALPFKMLGELRSSEEILPRTNAVLALLTQVYQSEADFRLGPGFWGGAGCATP